LALIILENEAVASALDQGCKVVTISPGLGLKEMDSIGTLLRYKPVVEKRMEDRARNRARRHKRSGQEVFFWPLTSDFCLAVL